MFLTSFNANELKINLSQFENLIKMNAHQVLNPNKSETDLIRIGSN